MFTILEKERELYFFKDVSRLCSKPNCSDSKKTIKSTFLVKEIKIKNLNEGFAKIEVTFLTNRFWHQTRFWNMICFYKSHVSQISVHRWCELITMERVQKKDLTAVCGFSSKALVGLLVRVGRENCFSFPSFNVFTRQVHLKAI